MAKKRENKMARGILACMVAMLLCMPLGAAADGVSGEAVFTKNGVACDAFWPGNTICATAQIVGDGSFDTAYVLLTLKSDNGLNGMRMVQISVTPVDVSAGINVVKGSITIPQNTAGDTLEAFCLTDDQISPLILKSSLPIGTGAEPVQRYTAVDPEVWGFETNSLGDDNDPQSRADWKYYTTTYGISNSVSAGTASIISVADPGEAANVKEGAFAAKLVGSANTSSTTSVIGIGRGYAQPAANSGKQRTIEGYMKIASLASDGQVRFLMRKDNMTSPSRVIGDTVISVSGSKMQGVTIGEWMHVLLTVPAVQTGYSNIYLGMELLGEGTVYFDGFRLLEDTDLVTNGSFSLGSSNSLSPYNRTVYAWSAQQGSAPNSAKSYQYNFRYDATYACVYHGESSVETAYLYQNANAFNPMVPGQTYDISLAYNGNGTPAVIIGEDTVTLTANGETTTRGTGEAAKIFTVYTGTYTLPVGASVPTVYKVTSTYSERIAEYYADFSIYQR